MKKYISFGILVVLLFGVVALPARSEAAIGSWQKAVTIDPRWTTDFDSDTFRESLRNLAATHANYVALVIPLYQSNPWSTDINAGWNTPTDESLASAIDYAHSLGLKVALKPHAESYDGQWRANINPGDRDGWFNAYGSWLLRYAKIAQAHGAEEIIVGSELINMSTADANPTNTQHWIDLIGQIRKVFSGKLTYSANWGGSSWADEKNHIQFWSHLDYIGIAAYFVLDTDLSVSSLKSKWDYWRTADIQPLQEKWGKPVLFTEIGYRSMNSARTQPFNSWDHWGYSDYEQSQLYTALFEYWNNYSWLVGTHLWNWSSDPNAGWSGNDDYTPQHKPAEGVMTQWFGSAAPAPEPTPTPTGSPTFTANGSTPSNVQFGQSGNFTASVTNGTSSASGIVVDLEIANSSDQKVFQKFYDGQSFAAGELKNFSTTWTPSAAGTYKFNLGIFNSNWSANYLWQTLGTFTVGSTPPPASTSTPGVTCPAPGTNAFTGCYYDNADFTNLKLARTDAAVNFDWANGSPDPSIGADSFSAVWTGQFDFTAGQYDFTATTDDGMQVKVDGTTIIDKYFDQPATAYTVRVPLGGGSHRVEVRYYENGGGAVAKVGWNFVNGSGPAPAPTPTSTPTSTPPGPSSAVVNIWWPTNGSTIQGVQPFKAMLEGWDIGTYAMFWQVDGDVLNPMANSTVDYPHKEAVVDVSGWNWKASGPYNINFLAKDSAGSTINQKAVDVFIGR